MTLHRPEFEKDSCGFGLVAHMDGQAGHALVKSALVSLGRLSHRGGVGADPQTGDGCGLLMRRPERFLRRVAAEHGWQLPRHYAAGLVFFHGDAADAEEQKAVLARQLARRQVTVCGWRELPLNPEALGPEGRRAMPLMAQVFAAAEDDSMEAMDFERRLFSARSETEAELGAEHNDFFVCSLSSRILVYKGMMLAGQMDRFYADLMDPDLESSLVVFHQRFSTNTLPRWKLAQPYRFLAHNGEINTIQGNRSWAYARRSKYQSPLLPEPRVTATGSDSLSVDNMLEYLWHGGLDVLRAISIMIPPAWQNVESMDEDLRAFYRYHSTKMESWDGPAGIVLSDGRYAVCAMDRNGLRPARYSVTGDRRIILASENGVSDAQPGDVTVKGRLMPGEIIAADTRSGELLPPDAIRDLLKSRRPYKQWLKQSQQRLQSRPRGDGPQSTPLNPASLAVYEKIFQVSAEERTQVVRVLAEAGQEAVGSMGDDTPIAVLSRHDRSLFDFFRQQFAQVTNPPIDPLREQIVMSLETCLGRKSNVFDEGENDAACVVLRSPVLSSDKLAAVTGLGGELYRHCVISLSAAAEQSLPAALDDICSRAEKAVQGGAAVIILSDRELRRETWPVHALLATGAVHRHLSKCGLRGDANLIVDTAVARDPHHFAVLIGFGATAIHPWLSYEIIFDMLRKGEVARTGGGVVLRTYRRGIIKGLYKIMSRMGISTVASYRAAKLFEVLGLSDEVVDKCFHGAVSRIQGIGFAELEQDLKRNCNRAWNPRSKPQVGGLLKYVNGGEYHACNPDVVRTLHRAVAGGDYEDYREFSALVNQRPPAMLRDLLQLKTAGAAPLPLDQVEAEGEIMRRFDSAGMSLGALSPEAHEALAEAMNSIGGRSNSGEGGEDPARYGTSRTSKIKQVASGRFGVTPAYLVNAEILQIKIAQGAKPGEGGQLPGPKVNPLIAGLRYSSPGVALISPPPHHDIYSIEDLAQLIYDLKQVNPEALVSVKLVAAAGVGTIAVGVAKCHADLITIAGYDGGTGASPLTSVKYSGVPWEMGIAETHQALRAAGMRGRVRLQADGGLKSGLDVVKAAILGAESFGFGTMPMVALGCKYLRICHLNNCATGIATQHPTLRKLHFAGSPQRVVHYFNFVAREAREILAQLGVRSLHDVIGRVDLLENAAVAGTRHAMLDLQPVLAQAQAPLGEPQFCATERNQPPEYSDLGARMVDDLAPLIADGDRGDGSGGREFSYAVRNADRAVGARLSGMIARRHGNQGLEDRPLTVRLRGAAGQSFGAWNAGGLHMFLRGEANDYVGKGMAGGKLVLAPPPELKLRSADTPIIGNTCLYGATGGKFFAAGCAGERFAVRNSGAQAVVEGVGDHGCEYMTGGAVAVLGRSGLNFGAGMTGGIAFVLDMERNFVDQCNKELVDIRRVNSESTEEYLEFLHNLVSEHAAETGSAWGRQVRDDFADLARHFRLVSPRALDLESLLSTLMQAA